jgi:hypothetical protein
MVSLNFLTLDVPYMDTVFHGAIASLENATVAFFWAGKEPRLGTLTVTLPDRSSSSLLGDRDQQMGLILGARMSALTSKMALVSTNLPEGVDDEAGKVLLDLVQRLLENLKESGEQNE